MKLVELHPRWIGHARRDKVGLTFDCPCGCGHGLVVMFQNPEDGNGPAIANIPGHYRDGSAFESLTLSPRIDRAGSCGWQGTITKGRVICAS